MGARRLSMSLPQPGFETDEVLPRGLSPYDIAIRQHDEQLKLRAHFNSPSSPGVCEQAGTKRASPAVSRWSVVCPFGVGFRRSANFHDEAGIGLPEGAMVDGVLVNAPDGRQFVQNDKG